MKLNNTDYIEEEGLTDSEEESILSLDYGDEFEFDNSVYFFENFFERIGEGCYRTQPLQVDY